MKKAISHLKFYALAVVALLIVFSAPVHAQHDMSNMPGMSKPKPKPKPRPAAAKRKQVTAQPKSKQDSANDMDGMDTPTPAPAPQPSPESMDANMPGMNRPTTTTSSPAPMPSPSPTSSPSPEKMEMNMPAQTPSAQPGATPGQMNMQGMQMPQTSAPPDANQTNPHATHDNMGNMDMSAPTENSQPSGMMNMNMPGMEMGSNGAITSRAGSGTSWQPASTPMHMLHWKSGDWTIMLHADAKVGVNSQGGPRGVTKFESQNWIMAMASRRVGSGTLDLRSMFSFEPFTLSPGGSPELFQTGETYKGQPLINKQHPHDLFMTLSASYTLPIGERGSWFAYLGFPGEPALGPIAFMHRTSASENPSAPLAHHLEDSTHISYGVFTTGFTYRWLKVEGSVFNGREPDENRYDFEFNPWNSRSARVSFAPNKNWAMQLSYGLLKNPEATEPGDVRRTTASTSYNKPLKRGNWATTLIWGRNRENHHNQPSTLNGYTMESMLQFINRNYLYTRLESVDKNGLLDNADRLRLGITNNHPQFRIGAYTFGAARDIWNTDKFSVALGGDITFYSKPAILDSIYGSNPTSYHFFLRFRLDGKAGR